jgi:hypothetical protein
MIDHELYQHPEPVPPASQLSVLPFLAAVDGYLLENGAVVGLRTTMHRAMTRARKSYLQQVCIYLPTGDEDWKKKVGRTFPIDTGIIGEAYRTAKICRTRRFDSEAALDDALKDNGVSPNTVARSWLSVPFLSPQKQVVLILFSDCKVLNFFADDNRVKRIVAMANSFCGLLDWLQKHPFDNLRNFPLQQGDPTHGGEKLYSFQEQFDKLEPPMFKELASFNFETAAI